MFDGRVLRQIIYLLRFTPQMFEDGITPEVSLHSFMYGGRLLLQMKSNVYGATRLDDYREGSRWFVAENIENITIPELLELKRNLDIFQKFMTEGGIEIKGVHLERISKHTDIYSIQRDIDKLIEKREEYSEIMNHFIPGIYEPICSCLEAMHYFFDVTDERELLRYSKLCNGTLRASDYNEELARTRRLADKILRYVPELAEYADKFAEYKTMLQGIVSRFGFDYRPYFSVAKNIPFSMRKQYTNNALALTTNHKQKIQELVNNT